MLKNFGKGLSGLLSTREEKQNKGEKVKKNGTHPKMNGAKHDYYDGRSSGSYKRYQPTREMEPSSRGHRDRRREGGNHPRQHPSREYDRSRRYYSDEQQYRVNQEYIYDRDRQQYQHSGYYEPSPRYHQDQHAYPGDPYAPPKPPRGHQSKNKIYLPEENEDSMVKRKNLQNRYNDYSGKPPRSPYNRNPSQSRNPSRDQSQQRYDAVSNRPSQHQHAPPPQRQTFQQTPSQYRSFGSEPESEVRNDRHIGESYNSYNKREPQQLFYPQSASLDRRGDKKQRHVNYDYDEYERMQGDNHSGYQSDRVVDERGYDYQIPEWLTVSDPSTRGSTSVNTYKPRSAFPKQNYRSDGEYDFSENSDTEYKRRGSELGGTHVDHTVGRELAGRMTPENYGRPSDSATKEYSTNYVPLRQYSGRVDYGHYSSDGEVLSEPERDPPPVPASAHYFSQPLHDDRRGYLQPHVHDGSNYQRSQLRYDSDPSGLGYSSDPMPSVKRRPMVEMEPEENDEPPPLRTVREIKAYNQHVKKIRKSSSENVLQRSTVTATYQPSPQSADPNLQNYKQPVSAFDRQPHSRGRSRSQERPFPAREFVRSQSPLSEPELPSTSLKEIRSRNNSAVFCIVSQTSPAVSSDQGSDTDPTPQKLAPSGHLQRNPPAKVTPNEHELLRSSSQESCSSSDASPKRYMNGNSSLTVRSDTPQSLGEVIEEPVVLPSATRGDVYAIRDLTEKQPEPKLRNFYKEEMDHQRMWNKYVNEFSEPEEVSQEPVILPSSTQGDVYAVREKPKDSRPVSKPRSFYQKELEAQAEQNKHAPDMQDFPKVVEEPLVLPSKTKGGNVYAVNDTTSQTRPGRIKPAYEGTSEGNHVRPDKNNSTPARAARDIEKPFSSSSAKGENSMPGNAGAFVDDPDGGGVQYRPLKRRSKSLDGRDSPFRSNHSGDETPVKESPVHQLVNAPKSHSMPRSSENTPNGMSNGSHPQRESKGEQLFKQKKKEAEFDDLRETILAAERLRRLKMIDAKADSEPDTAQRRRDFLFSAPPKKSTPPSIELRMYSTKNKTVEYPSHKKVFQRTDKSPLGSPKPVEYPGKDASGDPEPEPLVIEGMSKETPKQESVTSTSKEPILQEPGKDDTALDLLQIAELKRALREYEDDIHSPRGRRKNRRERSKSDLQNMLLKALVQLEQKEKENPNTSVASTAQKEEESPMVPTKAQPLSKLYRPPRSNDNLGYSSDSSQDPQHLSRAERLTGIPGVKIPSLKSEPNLPEVKEPTSQRDKTPKAQSAAVPQEDVFVQEAPLVTEELFPDEDIPLIDDVYGDYDDDDDDEFTEPVKDEVLDSGTEEELPPKREKNLLSILKAGNRSSVDSVSTVDSMSLARPFDDIGSEYEKMMSDHHENEESIGRSKTSSVDSLIHMASDEENKLTSKDAPGDETRHDAGSNKDGRRKRDCNISSSSDRGKLSARQECRGKPELEDLPEEGSMTSRSASFGVSKLRDRYGSERTSSLDSPRYSRPHTASSKSVGALQSRFSADKKESSSGVSSLGRTAAASSKPKNSGVEEKKRYGTPEKRLSSESGYGSLERDKSKDLTRQKERAKTDRSGSISKISENGSLASSKDSDFQVAVSVAKTIAQRSGSESDDSKKARMELYKEKRRKELAEKHGTGGNVGENKARKPPRDPLSSPVHRVAAASTKKTSGEEQDLKKGRRSLTETVKTEDALKARRNRRVSNPSMETQQLVETLELSRAARLKRLRRSETEESGNTYKILARHRERQSSVSSVSSDVFPSKDEEGDPKDPLLDAAAAADRRIKDKEQEPEESQPAATTSETSDSVKEKPISTSTPAEESTSSKLSSKQSRDRRRRQNVTISAEDVKEARRMGTKLQTANGSKDHSDAKTHKAPFKWEAKVETTRRPSLENVSTDSEVSRSSPVSRRKITASAGKVETVTLSKTSPTRSARAGLKDIPKSSSFDRHRHLKKDTSISSTDEDSSSTFEVSLKRQRPRSGNVASTAPTGSPSRKARVLPVTPGSKKEAESTTTAKREKKSGNNSNASASAGTEHKKEEKTLSLKKDQGKAAEKSERPKHSPGSPSRRLPFIPQPAKEPKEVPQATEKKEEKNERVVGEIEEEVISREIVTREQEMRNISDDVPDSKRDEKHEEIKQETIKDEVNEHSGKTEDSSGKTEVFKDEGVTKRLEKEEQIDISSDNNDDTSRKKMKKDDKKSESSIQRKTKSKTLQEKRIRSKTTEIPFRQTESPPSSPTVKKVKWRDRQGSFDSPLIAGEEVKRQALKTKDDELLEMMKMRAKLIQDHEKEEKAEKGEEESEEDQKQEEVKPPAEEVIKVSVMDRMSAFKQGDSAPLPKTLIPKTILKKPTSIDVQPKVEAADTVVIEGGGTSEKQDEPEEEKEEAPDQLASLSLSDKMKLFASLSQQVQKSVPSPKSRRRFPRQRSDDRSKTQPVTPEELHVIAKKAREEEEQDEKRKAKEEEERQRVMEVVTEEPEVEAKEDELTKMSLAEKMKLFHDKAKSVDAPPPPKIAHPKKKRRTGSRYTTQPITLDELHKASGPSPLVLSFGKGVDPELAAGLSVADQISMVYQAQDVFTANTNVIPSALPPVEKDGNKQVQPTSLQEKSKQSKETKSTENQSEDKLPSPSKQTSPPSPSFPKSSAVDKSIKKARSMDREEMVDILPDSESQTKKQSSTQKEIRAAAEKSRKEKFADLSSSESEVETKVISTMDQQQEKGIIKRHSVRQQAYGTKESERYKTQPAVYPSSETPPSLAEKRKKLLFPSRSFDLDRRRTQPVTPDEMAEVKHIGQSSVHKTSSIADRLSSLKQRGENDWRNRVEKDNDLPTSPKKSDPESDSDKAAATPSSISQRLKLLKSQGETWKKRVEDKDVAQFTVEGKMKGAGKELETPASPSPFRRIGSGRKPANKEFRVSLIEDSESESSNSSSNKAGALSMSDTTSVTTTTDTEDSEPDFQIVRRSVPIPQADNETFSKFYASSSTAVLNEDQLSAISEQKQESTIELSVSDFDALTEDASKSNRLAGLNRNDHRRSLRPQRRVRPSNNPLRALKTRSNILSEYTEEKMVLAEVEVKPQKKKDHGNKSLAALTSKAALVEERGKLHSVKDIREMDGKLSQLLPYKDPMLIQVKGRRMIQVRLVEPKVSSLNSGDCFICVTSTNVFLWIGQYANVIEKSKASEVAQHIQSKKDLGCKAAAVIVIEEAQLKSNGFQRHWKKMVDALGGSDADVYGEMGANDEDQIHEIYIIDSNMVYRLEGSSLEPYDDYWATILKYEMLKTEEILVFDFGSELYIWQGKKSNPKQRKKAIQLAHLIFDRGYDYSKYDLNPIYPQKTDDVPKKADKRPDWVLFAKTSEHMETILFQSKFSDWPNESRIIKVKSKEKEQKEALPEIVPFDAKLMVQPTKERTNVILEGTNVGRGTGLDVLPCNNNYNTEYFDKVERRGNKITTLSVVVWHVLEYTHSIVPKECFGQLHEGDTYVVRWQYRIEAAGARSLKGHASKWGQGGGRERCAYFFWQGSNSTINEKGASALMTVELDRERGPQRQVVQGKEPAVFLHLFQGRMMVHIGKREEEETNSQGSYRLYYIKGEIESEACLIEVPCKMKMLRSRTSFVLLNLEDVDKNKASIHIWHGVKSSEVTRKVVKFAAEKLKEFVPMEAGLRLDCQATVEEMEEGKETEFFFKAVGNDRTSYDSAIEDTLKYNYTLRVFHLTSSSGVFVANEVLNASRTEEHITPYPCLQSDLYISQQPALFIVDNHYEVYLWQGWWPEEKQSEDTPKITGSAEIKFNIERKCAMETVLAYCKEKNEKKPPEAFLIHAGLEPQMFVNLFPTWTMREDVAHINKKAGRRSDRAIRVKDVLQQLKRTRYTLAELREKPEGVDPLKLETYLSDEEFKKVLKVTREEFDKLQSWKKTELKKNAGLF